MLQEIPIPIKNAHGEDIPPFGVCVPTGALDGTSGALIVTRASADNDPTCLVNGDTSVPSGGFGNGYYCRLVTVAYDTSDGTPAVGESWGVKAANWLLRKDYRGFAVIGGASDAKVNAVRYDKAATGGGVTVADLTETTPQESWKRRTLNVSYTWIDEGDTGTNNATPVQLHGSAFTPSGNRTVIYWEEPPGSGRYAYLPIQNADATHTGYLSHSTQEIGGLKDFQNSIYVRGSLIEMFGTSSAGSNLVLHGDADGGGSWASLTVEPSGGSPNDRVYFQMNGPGGLPTVYYRILLDPDAADLPAGAVTITTSHRANFTQAVNAANYWHLGTQGANPVTPQTRLGMQVGGGIVLSQGTGALAIADGGTNATTAADARTNLGLGGGMNESASWPDGSGGSYNIDFTNGVATDFYQLPPP